MPQPQEPVSDSSQPQGSSLADIRNKDVTQQPAGPTQKKEILPKGWHSKYSFFVAVVCMNKFDLITAEETQKTYPSTVNGNFEEWMAIGRAPQEVLKDQFSHVDGFQSLVLSENGLLLF